MSNQIVISSGAKVRSLEGVLTGTAGIVSSVPLGAANGVATLDSTGKVPLSQLPASVVTYLGTWNAATNTPTLANGTGDIGDLYICNVAGTVNFGAGPITFAVGDWVIYNGSEWQKSAGQNGTVTSVAVTESGDALNITGSPITTAGTINIGFAGNSTQYINGEGNLVTFPTLITEAQNLITEVYNETGATLTKGTVVYINGGHGNLPTVTKAIATSDATSAQTFGVVQADISNNNNGHVVVIGSLGDLDTQAYAAGTQLYLSSTTAGAWTSVKQYAPAHLVYVGIVVRSHPTQGVVEVKIQNGFELDELHNVSAQTPSNNDGLFYNSSNSLWENKSIATALGYTPADDSLVVHLAGTETITGAKTFSSGVTISNTGTQPLKIANYATSLTSTSGYTTIGTNAAGFQLLNGGGSGAQFFYAASPQAYYLPSTNGTLALTSDIPSLANYVTLTGAQTITGIKTFTASVNNEDGLKIKLGSASNLTAGYLTLSAYGETTPLPDRTILRIGTAATQMSLFKLQNTGSYTYDLPATSGTLALTSDIPSLANYVTLTGAQTITGIKTFTNEQLFGNGITLTGGYITYTSGSFNLTLNTNLLTANRNVFLQDKAGTIALLSDIPSLSGYVPYTGATAAVNLGSNALTALTFYSNAGIALSLSGQFTGGGGYTGINGQALGIDIRPNSGGIFNLNFSSTTNRTFTFPDASGTLVLGTGTTNYLPKFTGTSTIGNSGITDDGTTVTLISRVLQVGSYLNIYSGAYAAQTIPSIRASSSNNLILNAASTGTLYLNYETGSGGVYFGNGASGQAAIITSAGAATFSSSIDATTANFTQTSSNSRILVTASGVANTVLGFNNSGSTVNGVGNNSAYIGCLQGYPLVFTINDTERMRITSSGNVGIGTSSPQSILQAGDFSGNNAISIGASTTGVSSLYFGDGTGASLYRGFIEYQHNGDYMRIGTSASEAMRITSGGDVYMGSSTTDKNSRLVTYGQSTDANYYALRAFSSGSDVLLGLRNDGLIVSGTLSLSPYNYSVSGRAMYVNNGGVIGYNSSTRESKSNIVSINDISWINQLNPVTFNKRKKDNEGNYIDELYDELDYGFIADEVEKVNTDLVFYDILPDGTKKLAGVYYEKLTPVLVKAIQEQQAQIEELKALINK